MNMLGGCLTKSGSRKPRQVKIYKNPHTGEVVETKGGNYKTRLLVRDD